MKTALVFAALFAVTATAQAQLTYPDQEYTVVACRDGNLDLRDAGTEIVITTGGFTGATFAKVSLTTFSGPMPVGTVLVRSQPTTHSLAPVIYIGQNFELAINDHAAPLRNGMFASHFKAEINGQSFDKEMACEFYAHPL